MKKRTRSILEELSNIRSQRYTDESIHSTGNNLIETSINFIEKLYDNYSLEVATDLEKRFISSIKNSNTRKFKAGITKVIESKE